MKYTFAKKTWQNRAPAEDGSKDTVRAEKLLSGLIVQHRRKGRILLSHMGDESCGFCEEVTQSMRRY